MTQVQAYISLKGDYSTRQEAEKAIEVALGYDFDTYVEESLVTREDSNGIEVDTPDAEWFGTDMQVVVFSKRIVLEYYEDEQYQSGTEFIDVPVEGLDAEGNTVTVLVKQEVPVYSTRQVTRESISQERWALSYVR